MILHVLFRAEARFEFDRAVDWYEERRSGRGLLFKAAIKTVLDRIAENPEFYAKVYGDVRAASVSRYPYSIYYREEDGIVVVYAVFHAARDPDAWQSRID